MKRRVASCWRPALLLLLLGILGAVYTVRERERRPMPVFKAYMYRRGLPVSVSVSVGGGKPKIGVITAKGYAEAAALLPPGSPPLTDRETLTLLMAAARHTRGKSSRADFDRQRDQILSQARARVR